MFMRLINPKKFLLITNWLLPILAVLGSGLFAFGLYHALILSPRDYLQGETVRIMYIHVPAAWTGLLLYAVMAGMAGVFLVFRIVLADVFCVAAAPVGLALVGLCLATGSLWGKPTWGAWWVWDARLTSVLVLFFLYAGYIILRNAFEDGARGARAGAFLLLIGIVNLPIVKFSVDWWHSLHQGASVFRKGGALIAPAMLTPLIIMAGAFMTYTAFVVMVRMRTRLLRR